MPSDRLNTFHDASGKVTVGVFRNRSAGVAHHHIDLAADVPEDMVAIGGGATAVHLPNGALLTASYPNDQLSAWLASSKDHVLTDPHQLTVYAIGLKIQGMSRAQLLDSIHINSQDSGFGAHPEATSTIPQGFVLVSGGFTIQWSRAGNLATASFPSTNLSWTARSKDHEVSSPATLRVYAIGLREQLPIGRVHVAIDTQGSAVSSHPSSSADVRDGYALTGGGAEAHWHTVGSLLWQLEPTTTTANQEFHASSKDHVHGEPTTITTYTLGIRIQ